ncbi:MAG: nucleotidyltransferase family protein [Candidatus Schekmanbacteria bacterium]|nr:nucleotidyltransferase family protein [Candidatus Schekmanbacteria bacterium]
MKTLEGIEKTLKGLKPLLHEKFKVQEIGIFGSYARGEESPESDVDILVGFYEPIGWEIVGLKEFLEKKLGKKVDLVTKRGLKPQLRDSILNEVVYT